MAEGRVVQGHWRRAAPSGTLPLEDWQDHVGEQLAAHAGAVQLAARAAAIREALTSYARGLTG
jgi:hypothetical protein